MLSAPLAPVSQGAWPHPAQACQGLREEIQVLQARLATTTQHQPQPPAAQPQVPQQPVAAVPHGGWMEHRDDSGRVFYYNSATQQSTWERPPEYNPPGLALGNATRPQEKGPPGANLFVARALRRGEFDELDSTQLRAAFAPYGKVTRAEIALDKTTGLSKGYGFVSFASVEEADRAIAYLNGQIIAGKPVRIEKTKEDHTPTAPIPQYSAPTSNYVAPHGGALGYGGGGHYPMAGAYQPPQPGCGAYGHVPGPQ